MHHACFVYFFAVTAQLCVKPRIHYLSDVFVAVAVAVVVNCLSSLISDRNFVSRQPRDSLAVLVGVQETENMAIPRRNSSITNINRTGKCTDTKKILPDLC